MNNKGNKTKKLNWRIIVSNLKEAREQIEDIEKILEKKKYSHEVEL